MLDGLRSVRLRRSPGRGTPAYSNLGAGLLGIALTTATGTDFGTLVRDRICAPLGLSDTATDDLLTEVQFPIEGH